jgi:hypothetical protein
MRLHQIERHPEQLTVEQAENLTVGNGGKSPQVD